MRALAALAWTLLGLVALAGVAVSGVLLLAAVPVGRSAIASAVVGVLDDAIAGRLELAAIQVLPHGGVELRGLHVYDPDGHLVLAVGRARASVDLTGLRRRVVGIALELEEPSVLVEEEPDGGTSLARAFAPSRPAPPQAPRAPTPREGGQGGGWTLHVSRLELRRAEVWWVDAAGKTRLDASGVDVQARGIYGPRRARAEVRLTGEMREPTEAPVAAEVVASLSGSVLRVPVLRASAGATVLEAIGEGDLARRRGRVALTRLGLSRVQARALVPDAPAGADLAGTGYADADGATLTAALQAEPVDGRATGRGEAAVAVRLEALGRAAGFDVSVESLDPARLIATAPGGSVTLAAHGAVAGSTLADARGRVSVSVAPPRLRGGYLSRLDATVRGDRATVNVERIELAAPGIALSGSARWRRGGSLAGSARVDARDLALASRNLALLAGEAPPALAGRARVSAQLSGTDAAPAIAAVVDAPLLAHGALRAAGVHLSVQGKGPLARVEGTVEGRAASVSDGGREVAHAVSLRAAVLGDEGSASVRGEVAGAGVHALALDVRGRFGPRRESLLLAQLGLSYPGTRWSLVGPAAIDLRRPAVDRLEIASGAQRIAIEGGLGARGDLDARLELARVDLARLPAGILPAEDGIEGELSGALQASRTAARPVVEGRISLQRGAVRGLRGLAALADVRLDGGARRVAASISAERDEGGTADVDLDVPLPIAGRPAQPISVRVRAAAVPVAGLLSAAGAQPVARGTIALEGHLTGTAGAPSLSLEASLLDGAWQDLDGLGAVLSIDAPGERARATLSASRAGRRALRVEAEVPVDLSEVLARPAAALRGLRTAPLEVTASVESFELRGLAGRAGVPRNVAGLLDARGHLTGSFAAPRAVVSADLTGGALAGFQRVAAHVELGAAETRIVASGRVSVSGAEALRFDASLGIAPERLARRAALLAAPLRAEAVVPRVELAGTTEAIPLAGTIEGRLVVSGTPRAPQVRLDASGTGVSIEGRPLGDAHAEARYAARHGEAEVNLRPSAGGAVRATLGLEADLGLGAAGPALRDAPAEATVVADALDLGFLPALAPRVIRSAGGQLDMDVRARGPLARLSPRGALHVKDGRVAVTEYGEWTDVVLDASMTDDALELARLDVRRGRGRLSASGALRDLRSRSAKLEARLSAESFTVSRAGMVVATVDLSANATGTYRDGQLAVEVEVPHGVVRLPKKTPRTLQSLDRRTDIVVGRREERRAAAASTPGGERGAPSFSLTAHVVAPRNFFVKGESPRMDIELKADVRYELTGGQDYAEGSIEVVRGSVEPIGGRNFTIDRGRVQFTGGPPQAALLDIEARYVNPAATVTVNVAGPATKPEIRLSSQPPMDEGQIAMLIATGRTEIKAGSGAVGTLTGEEAGKAALGAIATQAFRNLVADKLPLDTVALDSGALRAGKYVTDRIYVGYTQRFDADPTKGENESEVRVEYQISRRWMFESRYGNAQSGGASLIWSRQY